MTAHLYALSDEWALWRWFAVRAPGSRSPTSSCWPRQAVMGMRGGQRPPLRRGGRVQNRAGYHNAVFEGGRRIGRGKQVAAPRGTDANYWPALLREERHHRVLRPARLGRIDEQAPEVTAEPGPGLVARRWCAFESWCIEALADELARDDRIRPWIAPAGGPRVGARHTQPCSGRGARSLRRAAPGAETSPPDHVLADLEAQELIIWRFAIPLEPHPKRPCGRNCSGFGDADARHGALAALDAFVAGRDRVAAAAGDAGGSTRRKATSRRPSPASRARSRPAPRDGCTAPASSSTKTAAATSR